MGPTWVLSAPDGPHVGPMNLAIRDIILQPSGTIVHFLKKKRDLTSDLTTRVVNWSNVCVHPILRNYTLFKRTLAAEPYITTKMGAIFKKCIAKFRVSSHRLAIETGRHLKPPLPIESRICVHCPGELVDDELHLITFCKHHDGERVRLYQIAKRYIADFENLDNRAKFVAILGTSIPPHIIALGNFLHTCFRKRNT